MRLPRGGTAVLSLLALSSATGFLGATGPDAGAQTAQDDNARGVVFSGLNRSPRDGTCRGKFELAHRGSTGPPTKPLCTHGPDPAPPGVDVRRRRAPGPRQAAAATTAGGSAATGTASGSIPCYGSGTDGYRVQVVYARASNVVDRYADFAASLVQWTASVDGVVNASAAETGGSRHVRFVTDASCNLSVARVELSPSGDDNLSNTVDELRAMGFDRSDRKYLVYTDANIYCGIAQIYLDDSADPTPGVNANNGNPQVPGTVARVDNGCWGQADSVEAHELMHNLGGVQESAPHATSNLHCTDDSDRMCYDDGSGATVTYPCPPAHENRLDCNHDDYFSTAPPPLSYLATHWNSADSAFLAKDPPPVGAHYNPLTPARILDTRSGNGALAAPIGAGGTVDLQVAGRGGVPAGGVSSVVLNVTATQPTAPGSLAVFPTGEARPVGANVSFVANQTVPNLVVVKVGAAGKVSLYNAAGTVHVIADVAGWYDGGGASSGARYNSLTPARLLDTRSGNGAPAAPVGAGGTVDLQVTGRGGVPVSGVSAVVLNVTVTQPSAVSFLTVFPTGEVRPGASNLNFVPNQTVPNLVVAKVGTGGKVSLYNALGTVQVLADVAGWYDAGTATTGARYTPLTSSRILDTRSGNGAPGAPLGPGATLELQVTGRGGVPASGVSAVVLNVSVAQATSTTFLTVFPTGQTRPGASNLNAVANQSATNVVVAKVGANGTVSLYNALGAVQVTAEVAGWYDAG